MLVECVVNLSEGRDAAVLAQLDAAAGPLLRDRHSDPHHHRSVYTMVGAAPEVDDAARAVASAALALLDLRHHDGVHPRLGVLDVVPFVPYQPGADAPHELGAVVEQRDRFAHWLADTFEVPAFLYGPERTLPDVRRQAFRPLRPDAGPARPHPSAGASAIGARPVLVAYNVWVPSLDLARQVAPLVRSANVRALALPVGSRAQVSCNLLEPERLGPERLYDQVVAHAAEVGGPGCAPEGAELVGLIPVAVLARIPRARWDELNLSEAKTVESRL